MLLLLLVAVSALLYLFYSSTCRKPKGFPPGPKWWPVVGSALEISRLRKSRGCLYETLTVLFEKYGRIFGLKIGTDRIVVLNDYETIHSMLTNEDCDGRPTGPFYETRTWGERLGVLVTDGPLWVEQRRFILRHLREFGFGRVTMASLVQEEAVHLVDHLQKLFEAKDDPGTKEPRAEGDAAEVANSGQIYQLGGGDRGKKRNRATEDLNAVADDAPGLKGALKIEDMYVKPETYDEIRKLSRSCGVIVPVHDAFGVSVLNTLWGMVAGKRYRNDDRELIYLQSILTKLFKDIDMVGCLFSHFPTLRYVAPVMSGYKQFVDIHRQLWVFLNKELDNHKATFNPNHLRDLMDAYINILQTEHGESYSETQLLATCIDLFMAGSETTSKSLSTCFLYLVLYPSVQEKAQKEIDEVVGRDRTPTLADRPRMPYMDAIVLESLRMFAGRNMSIPHRALRDTIIAGYRIPKDTMLVLNFNRLLMDESWGDPEVFRPERFINDEGSITVPSRYIPFGHGKHRCMGELLAKSNIFLLTAALLQKFKFSPVPGEDKPLVEFVDGVTACPKPYRALVTFRSDH
ncbi:probable cytochrome P450 303a1 isoform X2 [Athalia rosae]|uniref:probable cytochrome P450 303a1 isoform X2 n=1 Tax=Athalia rosae TaxID=37344 RepID=UPI002033C8B3|nr:probable cytochrome P450 303a1 isoform X2 [Athalia rosae]